MKKQELKNIVRLAGVVEEIEEVDSDRGKLNRIRIGYVNNKNNYEHEYYDCYIEEKPDLVVGDSIQIKGHLDLVEEYTVVLIDTFIKIEL